MRTVKVTHPRLSEVERAVPAAALSSWVQAGWLSEKTEAPTAGASRMIAPRKVAEKDDDNGTT